MTLYRRLKDRRERLAVIGLGYVGLPLAVAFDRAGFDVIGYDVNPEKIARCRAGEDVTGEVGDDALRRTTVRFTDDEQALREAKFLIVAVPTPVNADHTPDLTPVVRASEAVGRRLAAGSIVVYESTVYPGCTEDVCVPILERTSGLRCGADFRVGYSPERINPGDRTHRLENIRKIVSGSDAEALEEIRSVYDAVITAGTYAVSNIRTAEAVKVAENSQRDLNIAFVNELAMVFDRMDIDTNEVIDAMNTKWNALGFRPGLVGGHCIGVDPYYFTWQAEKLGCHSQIILSGRTVNDGMGRFVADAAVRKMIEAGLAPKTARVAVLGLTFKENCADIRNSKVADIVRRLREYGICPIVTDPLADPEEARRAYGIEPVPPDGIRDADCVIAAVAHDAYRSMTAEQLNALYRTEAGAAKVLIDVKGIYPVEMLNAAGILWWRL